MLLLNVLLVLPAMTALAMPVVTVTKFSEVIKRGEAIAGPPVQPIPSKSTSTVAYLSPAPGPPAPATSVANEPTGNCADPCPLQTSPSELILPHAELVEEIAKRAKDVYAPEQTVIHSTTPAGPFLSPAPKATTVPLVPTSPSEAILPHKEPLSPVLPLHSKRVPEPNLPSFIDTGTCLCGLLPSQSTLPSNGEIDEMWRCTADASDSIINQGGNGKWYNTTLPSNDVSGVGEPRNWGGNPPAVGVTFVLTFDGRGGAFYAVLDAANGGALHGGDYLCSGLNDTSASGVFYAGQ